LDNELNKYKSELIDCKKKLENLRVENRYKYLSGEKEVKNIQFKSLINEIRQLIDMGMSSIYEKHEYAERNVKSIIEKLHNRIRDLEKFTKDESEESGFNSEYF